MEDKGLDYIVRVTWDEVNEYLNSIVRQVDQLNFTGVYGIPRGGSALGAWLAHKLYLPLLFEPQSNCIVIDDVCDGGRTITKLKSDNEIYSDNTWFVTVMFYRLSSSTSVNYYFKEKDDSWIVFPWEQ